MYRAAAACFTLLAAVFASVGDIANAQQPSITNFSSPGARVFFIDLKDGAVVPSKLKLRFGVTNMEIVPAGVRRPFAGHHHLLIDTPLPPAGQPVPSDFNHIHFGAGQGETEITLSAGTHTLQLLLADDAHIPHSPMVVSEVIRVTVDPNTVERTRTPAPANARVFFVAPADGATIPRKSILKFGISGMELAPAGEHKHNSGHHHLLVDTPLPVLDREIPSDFNHQHFGRAQTETEITLPPGEHTLQLLLGDHDHLPHDPPIHSNVIRVRVVDAPGQAAQAPTSGARQPSPPDASVYFIYPSNGATIYPNSTIRFGLRNMGVAPAGIVKPNTGHHHLLIDVETPPLDQPLPSDLNHIHFGNGQTERKISLKPGPHTLQLVLADDQHVPHDPPVMTERIKVFVKAPVRRKRR